MPEGLGDQVLAYRLCPRCFRAVPAASGERFCVNDGEKLLTRCPKCQAAIGTPFTRFCAGCGADLALGGASKQR